MEGIIERAPPDISFYQLKTFEKLSEIERDIRPPLVNVQEKSYQSWLSRLIADVFGIFVGYVSLFFITNFIRSAITHTHLYKWYWMFFGPYYFLTKAPLLTKEWTTEEELLEDAEGNTCLQNAKSEYENCKSAGGSVFRCGVQKDEAEFDCFAYPKCSTKNIESMVNLYINFVPVKGYDTAKSLLDTLRWINPLVGIADNIFTQNIPEFEPRPQSGHHSLNQDQKDALRSQSTLDALHLECMQETGVLGLRVRGLSYDDIDKYFNDNFKNLK